MQTRTVGTAEPTRHRKRDRRLSIFFEKGVCASGVLYSADWGKAAGGPIDTDCGHADAWHERRRKTATCISIRVENRC